MRRANKPESSEGFESLYDIAQERANMNFIDTALSLQRAMFRDFYDNRWYYNFDPHNVFISRDLKHFYFDDNVYFLQIKRAEVKAQYPKQCWETAEDNRFSSEYIVACSLLHALFDRNPFYAEKENEWLDNVRNLKFTCDYESLDYPALGHALTRVLQGQELGRSLRNANYYYNQMFSSKQGQEQSTEGTPDCDTSAWVGSDEPERDSKSSSTKTALPQTQKTKEELLQEAQLEYEEEMKQIKERFETKKQQLLSQ